MAQVTGRIDRISHNYEKFSVQINGDWFGTKQEWAPKPEPVAGETITFESGTTGKYLQKVVIVSAGGASAQTENASPPPPPTSAGALRGIGVAMEHPFPVGAFVRERAIIRQNALTNAVKFLGVVGEAEVYSTEDVIEVAREFEAYTSGDSDREEIEQAVAERFDSE